LKRLPVLRIKFDAYRTTYSNMYTVSLVSVSLIAVFQKKTPLK